MIDLTGKTAIVTGAGSGIGRASALMLARAGAQVVVSGRRAEPLEILVDEITKIGGRAVAVPGDVALEETAKALVTAASDRFGGLDIAVNNAGTLGALTPVDMVTEEDWRRTVDTNLSSAVYGAKHQIPAMRKRGAGTVIFVGTFVGQTAGMPGMAAYAASKAGLVGLMQVVAAENGTDGIRANVIAPGGTDTPMGRSVANTEDAQRYVASLHALNRIADPDEIAGAVLFLASDLSRFVTGSVLMADGGVSIKRG